MKAILIMLACLLIFGAVPASWAGEAEEAEQAKKEIIAAETASLERWGNGDPFGYIELFAEDFTYFDPSLERRLDGKKAVEEFIAPIEGKINIDRFDMIKPSVQLYGDVGILTFNLVDYNDRDSTESHWNSTEVYRKIDGKWMLVHSHWSFTKPDLK